MRGPKIKEEIIKTQKDVDSIVPGKVKISAEYDDERRCYVLTGTWENAKYGISTYTENMDRYYGNNKLFIGYFKQRQAYMMASKKDQLAFNDHPAFYKA